MKVTLTLPYLVAGRELAEAGVHRLGDIDGVDVTVDARPLASGSRSFAAQLVQSILLDGGAAHLTLLHGPDDFTAAMQETAQALGVGDRFSVDLLHAAS